MQLIRTSPSYEPGAGPYHWWVRLAFILGDNPVLLHTEVIGGETKEDVEKNTDVFIAEKLKPYE